MLAVIWDKFSKFHAMSDEGNKNKKPVSTFEGEVKRGHKANVWHDKATEDVHARAQNSETAAKEAAMRRAQELTMKLKAESVLNQSEAEGGEKFADRQAALELSTYRVYHEQFRSDLHEKHRGQEQASASVADSTRRRLARGALGAHVFPSLRLVPRRLPRDHSVPHP